jgi:hypothetical protein
MKISTIVETLEEAIANSLSVSETRRAEDVLAFYAARMKESGVKAINGEANFAMVDAFALWTMPDKHTIETTEDGRMSVVRKDNGGSMSNDPFAAPQFTPAVKLPVLQVSDVEKQAVSEMNARLAREKAERDMREQAPANSADVTEVSRQELQDRLDAALAEVARLRALLA